MREFYIRPAHCRHGMVYRRSIITEGTLELNIVIWVRRGFTVRTKK